MNPLRVEKKLSISETFHSRTKISAFIGADLDSKSWPPEWKKIYFKAYPRFKNIRLPKNARIKIETLKNALIIRSSKREFIKKPIGLSQLGNLLFYSAGMVPTNKSWDESRRFYPSAGARYPLEVYIVAFKVKSLDEGIYHYNVKNHSLELIFKEENLIQKMEKITNQDWIKEAAAILVISGVFGRTQTKYGDRGYRYILIESGHLGQNVYLVGTALGLKCCAVGGYLDDQINKLLDFNDQQEAVLYMLALGN